MKTTAIVSIIVGAVFGYRLVHQTTSFVEAKETKIVATDYRAISQKLQAKVSQLEKENKALKASYSSQESFTNELREKLQFAQEQLGDCSMQLRKNGLEDSYIVNF